MPLDSAILERYLDKLRRKAQSLEVSRRRFLQGTLAVGTVHLPLASLSDRTMFLLRDGRAIFLLDNMPRWIISPDRFAGDAELTVLKHTSNEIELRFSGGRYPGTALRVEMACRMRRSLGAWLCDFDFDGLGSATQIDLVSWLSGESIRLSNPERHSLFSPKRPIGVRTASGPFSLDASWTLRFRQASIDLAGVRSALHAETVNLRPAPSGYKSLLIDAKGPSSLITLERGDEQWGFDFMELLLRNHCVLAGPSEIFSSLEIECFESQESTSISAVFTPEKPGTHTLVPPGSLRDVTDRPFSLTLAQPMYAIAIRDSDSATAAFSSALATQHTAFSPDYALLFDSPVHIAGSIKVTSSDDPLDKQDEMDLGFTQLFLEQYEDDEDAKFDFLLPSNQDLGLWAFGAHPFGLISALRSLWHWLFHRKEILPIDGVVLRVTRPRDFLFLHFTFANMAISVRGGKPWLVPNPPSAKPVLTVYFLPQHIQEETFEENSQGGADGAQPAMPVDMTLSGPTSLSFNFPVQPGGEPLTLANLLAWQSGALRPHDDTSNLSSDQQASKIHSTKIEAPYRLLVDTVETSTSWLHQHCPREAGKATPELWHTSLVSQAVQVASAVRTGYKVKITFKTAQAGWKSGDTFAVLEPPEFAGTFVLTAVGGNTVEYPQALPDITRTNFTMSLANRFVAYSAVDYAPPIGPGGISWSNGISTIKFTGSIPFRQGDLINITPPDQTNVCNAAPGPSTTFEVASVPAQDTITFANLLHLTIADGSLVSLLTATNISNIHVVSVTVHVTTESPHGLRTTDAAFFGGTGTALDGKTLPVADVVSSTEFTVKLLAPGFTTLVGKGKMVINRVFTVNSGGQQQTVMQPVLYPITGDDRRQVVELSGGQPLAMEQLILSALGGWASMEGNFTPDPSKKQDLERFIYRFSQRRDYYVEVDHKGYLWPFGHRAILIKVTQRFFYSSQDSVTPSANVCYLRTRFFVVVKQKTRNFITPPGTGLQLPFVRIDILTDSTPALYALSPTPAGVDPSDSACNAWFWPSLAPNQPFLFKLLGYDSGNPANTVDFSAPLIFVSSELGAGDLANAPILANMRSLLSAYTTRKLPDVSTPRNRVSFGGASLHFAESKSPGDTELHVTSIDFSGTLLDATPATDPTHDPSKYIVPDDIDPGLAAADPRATPVKFRPVLILAAVDVPAVSVFCGQGAGQNGKPVNVAYNAQFLKTAFNLAPKPGDSSKKVSPNPTEIFVDIQGAAAGLQYPGPKGGGMAVPTAPITSIARHTGIVADGAGSTWDPTAAGATPPIFDPLKSFDLSNAKLLGCIPLSDAIAVLSDLGADLDLVPSLNTEKIYNTIANAVQNINQIETSIRSAQNNLHQFNVAIHNQINQNSTALQGALTTFFNQQIGKISAADATVKNIAEAYNQYALNLKTTLTQMQQHATTAVPQSDMDDLRAAADLDLATTLVNVVAQEVGIASIAIFTLQNFEQSLSKAATTALRPLDPSRLPTQQVAKALDDLVACFDPTNPQLSTIQAKGLALFKQLQKFFQIIKAMPAQVVTQTTLNQHLFDGYLTDLKTHLTADLKQAVRDAKTTFDKAITDHKTAFQSRYNNFNQVFCNNTLPTSLYNSYVTNAVNVAQGYVDAATTLAESDIDALINNAIGNIVTQVAGAADQVIGLLNQAFGFIGALEDLLNSLINLLQTPIAESATYTLAKIPMQDAPPSDPIFVAHRVDKDGQPQKALLEIDATVSASVTPANIVGAAASASTTLTLSDFSLQLLPGAPFITVQFQSFTFTASTNQGTHSQCKLDPDTPVILGDALSFVSDIAAAFAPLGNGAGSAPVIQLFGSGLGVGYSFTVPSIQAGGFQITGLAFEALLTLSFSGDPLKLRFYLATPQKHFLMSAGIFGGGGFFGLELSSQGVDLVQGCMEFGATAALNLVVASGEVHILGGIYFEFGDRRCILTGYVRAGGSLSILGIIEMSVEFYIGLTYEEANGSTYVYGTCTVTVSISILFFSADVSISMEWQWEGSKPQDSNNASLDRPLPLYAMLETGSLGSGIASDAPGPIAFAGNDTTPTASQNPRLAGWDDAMWDLYTSAFMKESPSHA